MGSGEAVQAHAGCEATQPSSPPMCDLVLLSWNRPNLLVPCVERLLAFTDVPSRLFILDNASTDRETLAYLDQLHHRRGTGTVELVVVRRPRNDGFAIGMNDGLSRTSAPWICLLNNDILVTDGWLSEMIRVAAANPQIGLVNPLSNEFNVGPSMPGPEVDAVATQRRADRGRWLENWMGVGFCLLFSRQVFERVGYFDDQFRFLYGEDADYSLRVQASGLICAIAEGAYVFHHKRSTPKENPALAKLLQENEARFFRKWQKTPPQRIAYVLGDHRGTTTSRVAERLRALANEGHSLWVFHTRRNQPCVPRHFKIRSERVVPVIRAVQVVARVLTKKKRFQRLIVSERWLGRLLQLLALIHRAAVAVEGP